MGKVVLIGSSTGVGCETAVLLGSHGYKVYASIKESSDFKYLKARCKQEKVNVEVLVMDVTKLESVKEAVKEVISREGKIDILVNNAGAGLTVALEDATYEQIEWITNLNYMGTVRCIKEVIPYMRERGKGRIVNITSIGGLIGQPFLDAYCGAKFAVEGLSEAMSTYLGKMGIQVVLVEPGAINTKVFENAAEESTSVSAPYKELHDQYKAKVTGRLTNSFQEPGDVAKVIAHVATCDNPPVRTRTSEWAERFCSLKTKGDPDGTILRNVMMERSFGSK